MLADLEQREQALHEAQAEADTRRTRADAAAAEADRLRRELAAREAGLAERARHLDDAADQLRRAEGLREEVARREVELAAERETVGRARDELAGALATASAGLGIAPSVAAAQVPADAHVLFVPAGASYRLVEVEGAPPPPGAEIAVDGGPHVVVRLGPSPLPGDRRRCAYLERVPAETGES
jgi:uncharacterized protein (DUF3084 family)